MSSSRKRLAVAAAAAIAIATQLAITHTAQAATAHPAAKAGSAAAPAAAAADYTAAQVLAGVQKNSTSSTQVNSKPHINTMTRSMNVNVYQPAPGVYSYTSSMAIDDDGSDPDPDPDHQGETTFQDSNGAQLAAHHVPFFVLGDDCWDKKTPCPHFFYKEHGMSGRQFALMFYKGKVIGSIFGDTQTGNSQTTSDNDSRELGEASVKAASLLGIPSSGTTGGVDNGVTVVMFSGPSWVVNGSNANLSNNAQALVQKALNTLGAAMDGGGTTPPPPTGTLFEAETGSMSSGGTFDSNHTGFTGSGFANPANAAGSYLDIPVTADSAGTKTLTFRYSDGTSSARPATISVNGTSHGTLNFPVTSDWNTWSTATISVPLTAGANTIRVTGTVADGPANIDSVTVS
ncbi:Carbohydrate binding family 6 [Catenulispora acidiphila DSM 44928]|uniref:Carbohydrate binding family 6 n=1 Tax=Catenulispora acidiphila (strain DSM 44928 / JCM 14897 / NBRC 102108 / NRRL B-24433 / ID139908) TaxID=479433 RepID=C7QH48_CATAD|nr:glycoside hydrolase family 75 protein [Catenulispora acidiphila]ACU76898.1 Carbohydrate binding family 6 [Catenulispora acidiphila DSM 44928]